MNTIIINGGNPKDDCPKNWDEAKAIQEKLNSKSIEGINWEFDCGFKLDFDGSIISVCSRFYPPKEYYGNGWDGSCTIKILGTKLWERSFKCDTLEQLEKEVTEWVKRQSNIIKSRLNV